MYNIGRVLLVVVHRLVLLVERHTSGTGVEALGDGSHTVFLADRAEDDVDLLERELRGKGQWASSAVELIHLKRGAWGLTLMVSGIQREKIKLQKFKAPKKKKIPPLSKAMTRRGVVLVMAKLFNLQCDTTARNQSSVHSVIQGKDERRDSPLRSVGESDTVSPRPGVEQLRDVDPNETSPGEAVRDDEEVDEDGHPYGSSRSLGSVLVRGVGVEDGTDHHEEDSHTQGTRRADRIMVRPVRSW